MVSKTKTIVTRSCYQAPSCKIYSITAESSILIGSDQYGDSGKAGQDSDVNNYDDDF